VKTGTYCHSLPLIYILVPQEHGIGITILSNKSVYKIVMEFLKMTYVFEMYLEHVEQKFWHKESKGTF
jgi:hypothetical protein